MTVLSDGIYVGILKMDPRRECGGWRVFYVADGKAQDLCPCAQAHASAIAEDHVFVRPVMSLAEADSLGTSDSQKL